jgi:hypothetical protein
MDSGATNNFIDQQFVERYHILMLQKESPRKLHVANGREIDTGKITQEVNVTVVGLTDLKTMCTLQVTNNGAPYERLECVPARQLVSQWCLIAHYESWSPNHSTPTARYVDEKRLKDEGHLRVLCCIYASLSYM